MKHGKSPKLNPQVKKQRSSKGRKVQKGLDNSLTVSQSNLDSTEYRAVSGDPRHVPKTPAIPAANLALLATEFDEVFYKKNNPDVDFSAVTPLLHYATAGWREGRDPSPDFSTTGYLKLYADIAEGGIDPFLHYLRYGRSENRAIIGSQLSEPKTPAIPAADRAIAADFDSAFYTSFYPDIAGSGLDPLSHFIARGWRERRDPSANFSTSYYLDSYADVRDSGVNPLYHYVTQGRLEGRIIARSDLATIGKSPVILPQAKPARTSARADCSERFGVVVMVKNEADIIETFAAHVLELFDVVVFLDHGSADGTFEFVKRLEAAHREVTVYRLDVAGFIQAQAMNHIVRTAKELQGVDWLFLIDADEFLPFTSREQFARTLAGFSDAAVISMPWKNIVPESYWDYRVGFDRQFYVPATNSSYAKVAFQPKKLRDLEFWIEQGNHSLAPCEGGRAIASQTAFHLWHLPVRSINQLSLKLSQGVAGYLKLGRSKKKYEGAHWFKILSALNRGEIAVAHLDSIISAYGIPDADLSPISREELVKQGYHKAAIAIAKAELTATIELPDNIAALIFRINAELASQETSEIEGRPIRRLETTAGRVIRRRADDTGYMFTALPPTPDEDEVIERGEVSDQEFIQQFLRPTYWTIDDLTPTTWGGHIPFMFAFVSAVKPRRYAELGTHWGASFFAYCQAVARAGFESSAVAIDSWQGDKHAGHYDEKPFNSFTWIVRQYARFACYLREYFDDAVKRFENGSVDLLHIDGLHTYEAVRDDFETWLPKMSDRGVIFVHDVCVHERDFGVWQFWREIRARYPSLQLRHCNGLGIVYVGTLKNTRIERFLRLVNDDDDWTALVQHHLERMGEMSCELAQKTFQLKQSAEQIKTLGHLNEEISRLRQQKEAAERERDQLRQLLRARSAERAS